MNAPDDKFQAAFQGALIAFGFALVSLALKEWFDRRKDARNKRNELRALIDLYANEVVTGAERCAQYVRQACLREVSRSRLSILIGPSKLDRAAAIGANQDCLKALHDVYRVFDLVQNQVEKRTTEDFLAIYSFVMGEFHQFTIGVERVVAYAKHLHGVEAEAKGRRQLAKLARHIVGRLQTEFFSGKKATWIGHGLLRYDLEDLEKRAKAAGTEILNWGAAHSQAMGMHSARGNAEALAAWVDALKDIPLDHKARIVRTLFAHFRMLVANKSMEPILGTAEYRMFFLAVNQIIGLPLAPKDQVLDLKNIFSDWVEFFRKNDPQDWDVRA